MPVRFDRRRVLHTVCGIAPAALLWACGATPSSMVAADPTTLPTKASGVKTSQAGTRAEVLIVGAGIAGLAAAQALRRADYSVVVLEARNRVGGRIWTSRDWPGSGLDLGASWIHGRHGNPLTQLAKQVGAATMPTDYNNSVLYDANGDELSDAAAEALDERLDAVLEQATVFGERLESDTSLQTGIDRVTARMGLSVDEQRALRYAINTNVEHEYAADASELSLWYWDDGNAFAGEDLLFPQGYDQLTNSLASGLDIRTEQQVTTIAYNNSGVQIATLRDKFQAERAIITLPLGVLQSGTVSFAPALPQAKQRAIERLGMGVLNKTYLRFPQLFWEQAPELIGYIAREPGQWCEWLNMAHYTQQPILLGFNAGSYGRAVERLVDAEVVAAAMRVLRAIYGANIPEPEAALITRWGSDPWARGAYSFQRVGSTSDDRNTLAANINNRLFFAGEATSREYAATVHGALLSGEHAARELIAR